MAAVNAAIIAHLQRWLRTISERNHLGAAAWILHIERSPEFVSVELRSLIGSQAVVFNVHELSRMYARKNESAALVLAEIHRQLEQEEKKLLTIRRAADAGHIMKRSA